MRSLFLTIFRVLNTLLMMKMLLQERMKAINERRFQKIEEEVVDTTDDILENLKNMASEALTLMGF